MSRIFYKNNMTAEEEYIPSILKTMPELRVLDFSTNKRLTLKSYKAIGKILSDYKFIKEVNLSENIIDSQCSKEIADGLVRAKNLEILKMTNTEGGLEMDKIIYNLAFSP